MTRGIKNNLPDRWCAQCGIQLFGRRQFKFCSSHCSSYWWNNKRPLAKFKTLKCIACGNDLKNKHQRKFCSHSCSAIFSNLKRKYLSKKKTHICLACGKITFNPKYCSKVCYIKNKVKYKTPEEAKKARRAFQNEAWYRYMAKKKNQTPIGVDIKKLQEIYLNCPEGYEVDHRIPISKGGLHHPENLQYLTESDNRKKSNKMEWRENKVSNPI